MTDRITQTPSGLSVVEHVPPDTLPAPPKPDWPKCQLCGKEAVGLTSSYPIVGHSVQVGSGSWSSHSWVCRHGSTLECPDCSAILWQTRHENGGPWCKCPVCGCGGEYT